MSQVNDTSQVILVPRRTDAENFVGSGQPATTLAQIVTKLPKIPGKRLQPDATLE
jgi:hypothetical protein